MKKFELLAASAIVLIAATPAVAQTAPSTAPVTATDTQDDSIASDNDIVITATKRAQSLQDVPISVSVTSADTVEKARIVDLIDLQSIVPSLKVAQFNALGQTNFTIRGFGNGNGNDGIESSVGVFIDGVYRSRSAAALDDLPEIERIEVLRGPQSTLFGKNVSAGAISIVTKKPSFDWGGKVELTTGNYGAMVGKASITGPLGKTVAFRVSGSINQRDGFFNNITTGSDVTDRNRWSVRGDLLWEPSSDFSIRVIGDYNLIRERCCGVTSVYNGPRTLAIGALGFPIANTADVFSRNVIFNTNPSNRLVGKGVSAQIDWNVGFARLTSITAFRNQINQSDQDIDFTGADIVSNRTGNNIKTFTQEIRLASDNDGPFSWLIGGFYQHEILDTGRDITYGRDARAYVNALSGGPAGLLAGLESLLAATGANYVPGSTFYAQGTGIHDFYRLKQNSFSIFGQADYKIGKLTLTGGLAYLNDRKAAVSDVRLTDRFSLLNLSSVGAANQSDIARLGLIPFAALPASLSGCLLQKGFNPATTGGQTPVNLFGASLGASLPGPGTGPCPLSAPGVNPFALNGLQFFYGDTANHAPVNFPNANESGILKGDKFTYAARAAYDFGAVNLYVSYSTGWKAGAYNLSSDSRPPLNGVGRSASPENVTVYEAGLKAKFRGGYFNLAVFKQTIKGFQSNAFTGLGYSLVNAGQESVKGFEVDAAYAPMNWLSFTGAATYLDPKYDSFTGAACVSYDTVRCPLNQATGLRPSFRNLTGETPAGIPKWSVSGAATLSHNFGDIGVYLRGEYDYVSKFQLTETTPPSLSTYGFNTVNASFGIASKKEQLEVMFWVRNLTKDNALISTFPTVAQDATYTYNGTAYVYSQGSYSGYPSNPRTYGVTLRKSF